MIPAIVYFLMGCLFLFAAYKSAMTAPTIWNATTVILTVFTTFMFGACIRLIRFYLNMKKHMKKK